MKKLSNGTSIPTLGFGTWRIPKEMVGKAVNDAIEVGFTHIDCATLYNNEHQIGKDCLKNLSTPRDKLYITSKLWNTDHAHDRVIAACETTLRNLHIEYLDLYLMHWPTAFKPNVRPPWRKGQWLNPAYKSDTSLEETWKAMEELVDKGLVRSIGVSNFTQRNLEELLQFARIMPAVNQIEFHPYLYQKELLEWCRSHNIQVAAYSPLAQGQLLNDSLVASLAEKYSKTPAQILLRWGIEHDLVVICKSQNKQHMIENLQEFVLEKEDVEKLNGLNRNYRSMSGWIVDQWL